MANYPKELTDLLNQYLTDGVMTSKEREVLLRKAEAMNVDKDEFDLFIDAEIQKIDQKMDAMKRQAKGRLCPFCEAQIPMLADKCPECGGNITPEATKELEEIIEKLEDALVNFKSGKDFEKSKAEVERYIRKANLYYENNPKVKILVREVEKEIKNATIIAAKEKRQKILISIFTNPWVWVLIEVIVAFALYSYFEAAEQEAYEIYSSVKPWETTKAMRNAIDSAQINQVFVICFGVAAVIATSIYAIKRKR